MHSGGKTVLLACDNYQAKIVTVGAGIAELTYKNKHLIIPHHPEQIPPAHMGKILIPWPNRTANGTYDFEGTEYKLPITEHTTKAAIHGFLAWRNWCITKQSESSVTLTAFLPPSYGYPFLLQSTITYSLIADEGLMAQVKTKNIGNSTAPYGVGTHPYLTCNLAPIDQYEVTLPATQVFAVDDALNPTHLMLVNKLDLDFTQPKRINATLIDNTFKANTDKWTIQLTSMQQGMTVYLCSDQPWIQIYTGDKINRIGLAIEPMSCPPNAFNSKIDLVSLKPQDEYTMHFTIGGYVN